MLMRNPHDALSEGPLFRLIDDHGHQAQLDLVQTGNQTSPPASPDTGSDLYLLWLRVDNGRTRQLGGVLPRSSAIRAGLAYAIANGWRLHHAPAEHLNARPG